jgi:argininosuccinate lyase
MADELIATGNADETQAAQRLSWGLAWADLAHAVELMDSQQISPATGARLLEGLMQLPVDDFPWNPARGDAFSNREKELAGTIGVDAAGWLGAGRPRREAMRVGLRLTARRGVLEWAAQLERLTQSLTDQARQHSSAVCADYTYLQVAQPTTVGHWLLTSVYPALRDIERAQRLETEFAKSVAGVGGSAGSSWPLDRDRLAASLGAPESVQHCRDAMWQTDTYLELLQALATSATWMSQLAQDLEIWASAEFGFVTLSDSHSRESALMPQKRNPYALVVVRTHAARIAGDAAAALTALHTGSARTDHFQLLNDVVPAALERAALVTRLFASVVGEMKIDAERMRAATQDGAIMGADVADALARTTDLDYRTAHAVVGQSARRLMDEQRAFSQVDPALLADVARAVTGSEVEVDEQTLRRALDPAAAVQARSQLGSSSSERMQSMLQSVDGQLKAASTERSRRWETLEAAHSALVTRAQTLRDTAASGAST